MHRWEYGRILVAPPRVIDRSDDRDERVVVMVNDMIQDFKKSPEDPYAVLNQMGDEGWELVDILELVPPMPNSTRATGMWEYILKRQKA